MEKNAAFVGHAIDIPGFFEDMLRVAPATKNIEIVLGATSLERAWRENFEKAAAPLADRIKFTYYNDLSFDQMLERAANLPPNSFIFFMVLLRDAGGVTVKSDDALARLHRVANAPINGLFIHQLGAGIVGGRLLDGELLGKKADRGGDSHPRRRASLQHSADHPGANHFALRLAGAQALEDR